MLGGRIKWILLIHRFPKFIVQYLFSIECKTLWKILYNSNKLFYCFLRTKATTRASHNQHFASFERWEFSGITVQHKANWSYYAISYSYVEYVHILYIHLCHIEIVFSTNRGETQSRGQASTGVVNSRYDYSNRHYELIDPLISVKTIGVIQLV